MTSTPFCIRLPEELDRRLKATAAKNSTTKTEVMLAALAKYLDCETQVPLTERMAELEARLEKVEDKLAHLN